jgi:hypothetical protein
MVSRRAALVFGIADFMTAALIVLGVFAALPARYLPVDSVAALLAILKLASSATLLVAAAKGGMREDPTGAAPSRRTWAQRLPWAAAACALAVGLSLVSALALTASWLSGVYGTVGRGGALVLVLVAALALPYLVVLPAVELVWFGPKTGGADARG